MTSPAARALAHVRGLAGPDPGPPGLFGRAVITVSFHPDQLLADGRTVAEHLVAEGVYRSQFETGISNGGLGGDRAEWERRMFGRVYEGPAGRPVYGGLNLAGFPDGASPRFGSCHLVLRPEVSARATFSHGDSVLLPSVVATADTFGGLWAALLEQVAGSGDRRPVRGGGAGRRGDRPGGAGAGCAPAVDQVSVAHSGIAGEAGVLTTARWELRRPVAADAGAVLRIHRDPRACAHNPADLITCPAGAAERCLAWVAHWRRHGFGYWVLRPYGGGVVWGFCGVKLMTLHGREVLNLFYRLDPAVWGAGLASEAATAAVGWAVEHGGGRPVVARVRPANAASARVAVRAGLRRAAHLDTEGEDGLDEIYVSGYGETGARRGRRR